jgi:hypothetical protein
MASSAIGGAGRGVGFVREGDAGMLLKTWAPDGRATFTYGDSVKPGEARILWNRIGTRDIYVAP